MNDKQLPFFMRQYGGSATDKLFVHESHFNDKVPADQTYQQEAGIYTVDEFESRPPVPNRNQREPRGIPYKRAPLQGFDRHGIESYSSTERLIKDQTFADGYPRSHSGAEMTVRKDKLGNQLKKIDNDINKLNEILEKIDDVKEPEEYEKVQGMIKELKNQKDEIQHAINPNFKIEQGIENMVQLLRSMSISSAPSAPSVPLTVSPPTPTKGGSSLIQQIEELSDRFDNDFPTQGATARTNLDDGLIQLQKDFKDGTIDRDEFNDGLKDILRQGINDYNGILETNLDKNLNDLLFELKQADDDGLVGANTLSDNLEDTIKNLDKKDPNYLDNYADTIEFYGKEFDNLKTVGLSTKTVTPPSSSKGSKKSMASTGSTIMSFLSSFYADVEDKNPIDDIEYGDSEYKDLLDEPLKQLSNNDNMKLLTKNEATDLLKTFERIQVPSGKNSANDKLKYDKTEALLKLAKSLGGDQLVKQKIYENVLNSKGTNKGLPKDVRKQVKSVIVSSSKPSI